MFCIICCDAQNPREFTQVEQTDICFGCIRSLFQRAIDDEANYPPQWASLSLHPDHFAGQGIFSAPFLKAYRFKEREYNCPPAQRVYCSWLKTPTSDKGKEKETAPSACNHFLGRKITNATQYIQLSAERVVRCAACTKYSCLVCGEQVPQQPQDHRCVTIQAPDSEADAFKDLKRGRDYQICPSERCGRRIELSDGCNHIICWCKMQFCFVCGEPALEQNRHWSRRNDGTLPPCPRYNQPGQRRAMYDGPTTAPVYDQVPRRWVEEDPRQRRRNAVAPGTPQPLADILQQQQDEDQIRAMEEDLMARWGVRDHEVASQRTQHQIVDRAGNAARIARDREEDPRARAPAGRNLFAQHPDPLGSHPGPLLPADPPQASRFPVGFPPVMASRSRNHFPHRGPGGLRRETEDSAGESGNSRPATPDEPTLTRQRSASRFHPYTPRSDRAQTIEQHFIEQIDQHANTPHPPATGPIQTVRERHEARQHRMLLSAQALHDNARRQAAALEAATSRRTMLFDMWATHREGDEPLRDRNSHEDTARIDYRNVVSTSHLVDPPPVEYTQAPPRRRRDNNLNPTDGSLADILRAGDGTAELPSHTASQPFVPDSTSTLLDPVEGFPTHPNGPYQRHPFSNNRSARQATRHPPMLTNGHPVRTPPTFGRRPAGGRVQRRGGFSFMDLADQDAQPTAAVESPESAYTAWQRQQDAQSMVVEGNVDRGLPSQDLVALPRMPFATPRLARDPYVDIVGDPIPLGANTQPTPGRFVIGGESRLARWERLAEPTTAFQNGAAWNSEAREQQVQAEQRDTASGERVDDPPPTTGERATQSDDGMPFDDI